MLGDHFNYVARRKSIDHGTEGSFIAQPELNTFLFDLSSNFRSRVDILLLLEGFESV